MCICWQAEGYGTGKDNGRSQISMFCYPEKGYDFHGGWILLQGNVSRRPFKSILLCPFMSSLVGEDVWKRTAAKFLITFYVCLFWYLKGWHPIVIIYKGYYYKGLHPIVIIYKGYYYKGLRPIDVIKIIPEVSCCNPNPEVSVLMYNYEQCVNSFVHLCCDWMITWTTTIMGISKFE